MDQNKLHKALGLAKRSNKLIYGQQLFETFSTGKLQYVIIANNMGKSQRKKLINKCLYYHVSFNDAIMSQEELAQATGMKTLVAIGIIDKNISQLIKQYLE